MIERVITLLANEDHCYVSNLSALPPPVSGRAESKKQKRSTRGLCSTNLEMLTRILHQFNLEFPLLVPGTEPGLASQDGVCSKISLDSGACFIDALRLNELLGALHISDVRGALMTLTYSVTVT